MKNVIGDNLTLTLFGESHGEAVGAILDGMSAGVNVNKDFISLQMGLRKASGKISTARTEEDEVEIISGVFEGKTTGTPITFLIKNSNIRSSDYEKTKSLLRPGHADYTAYCKYKGFQDYRGGGHFSGRVTAGIVAAGAICLDALRKKGIYIASHISLLGGIIDEKILDFEYFSKNFADKPFPVINDEAGEKMISAIENVKENSDSIGGILETVVFGIPSGVGDPWFSSVESDLSKFLFSIPAVKGVEFGAGFSFASMLGSEANDEFYIDNGTVKTVTNNNGGINGGITNGMRIVFRTAIKPTPSIAKTQRTVDIEGLRETEININGRHDPAIIHRARAVINAATAICISDMLIGKYGSDYFGGNK